MNDRRFLLSLLLLGAVVRLCVFVTYQPWAEDWTDRFLGADPGGYWKLAQNLVHHRAFSMMDTEPYMPDANRTPIYPFFLAALMWCFGERAWPVFVIQMLLSLLLPWLVYRMCKFSLDESTSRVAAVLATMDIYAIEFSCLLWSDFVFLLLIGTVLFLTATVSRRERDGKPARISMLLLGVAAGLAALTRPIAQYLLGLILLYLLGGRIFQRRLRGFALAALCAAIGWFVAVSPWLYRNYTTFGHAGISSIKGANLLFFHAAAVLAKAERISLYEAKSRLSQEHWRERKEGLSLEDDAYYLEQATRIFRKYPLATFLTRLEGMGRMFRRVDGVLWIESADPRVNPPAYFHILRSEGMKGLFAALWNEGPKGNAWFFLAHLLFLIVVYIGGFFSIGAFVKLSSQQRFMYGLHLLIVVYFVVLTGALGGVRYRLPLHPSLVIFAAIGFTHCGSSLRPLVARIPLQRWFRSRLPRSSR